MFSRHGLITAGVTRVWEAVFLGRGARRHGLQNPPEPKRSEAISSEQRASQADVPLTGGRERKNRKSKRERGI